MTIVIKFSFTVGVVVQQIDILVDTNFSDLLEDADACAVSEVDKLFIANLRAKFQTYGLSMRITLYQHETLYRLAGLHE